MAAGQQSLFVLIKMDFGYDETHFNFSLKTLREQKRKPLLADILKFCFWSLSLNIMVVISGGNVSHTLVTVC